MEQLKQQLRAEGIAYRENEPLAAHCTFKIGGPADVFARPETQEQLCRTIALCRECGVKYYLLGNGSNILFEDAGYRGVVIDTTGVGKRPDRAGVCLRHPRHRWRSRLYERRCLRRRDEGRAG